MNNKIRAYQQIVKGEEVPIVYKHLLSLVMRIKAHLEKRDSRYTGFKFSNVSPGYMDYTYFPFYNEYLRGELLRFGIVLNHAEMRFELWLMGQNAEIQDRYWQLLKDSKWNQGVEQMPMYSVLETVLVDNPNFNNEKELFETIATHAKRDIDEIIDYLQVL
ncbi:hypothetical protein HX025_09660 [Myroides odoratimimus]|uniref:DUF7000 family protein n=1 Tax=Myroides odoratimimus TaxID=76832 RepID=UPI00217FB446|nr:hypothetical protein [Myroides odoratimimus]MCS7473508.1 hypothetical protein [Myroides odoratimimus]MDM1456910.1 hypothetical protein [Myroides odoratimimus]